ncbi:two-component response regulator ORR3-like [Macadamia integrifolia]|uniref:two-component response regulator ORR3-like n=1 Tax=Macadamia integrifolia TaxID=60698 RepID=UPI001C4F29B8|nr:two-component response regulator ORR3-like [Macadamia integrifolia]
MAEPDADISASSSSCSLIHVLAVDDCLVDRKVVEKLLKAAKFKVTIVESGKKAMEILQLNEEKIGTPTVDDQKIDIILTDYCMPEMNGFDLLKVVKENNCLKSMPVVIMSSEHVPERISSCLAAGAEEFIQKPLKLRDLQRLRNFVKPATTTPVTGMKRKVPLDLLPETNASERRPRLAGVVVA